MKIGYTRVSKQEQNEDLQRDALKEVGCKKYFGDKITGSKFERKGLEELLAFVRSGDTVVVWKLDRLGRSLKDGVPTFLPPISGGKNVGTPRPHRNSQPPQRSRS